jgi:hypothetical protein
VVDNNRVALRVPRPRGAAEIEEHLTPWLR